MPALGPRDDVVEAVGHTPRRIAVAGVSGAGKTTLADRIAKHLGLPRTELDALHHGPGWTPRPEFLDDVRAVLAQDAWAIEFQYPQARPLIAQRAEVVVWLDLPTPVTMRQVVVRTLRRRREHTVLWNGNVEPPWWKTLRRPDENIVWWAWRSRASLADLEQRLARENSRLVVVRLRSHEESLEWLQRLPRAV